MTCTFFSKHFSFNSNVPETQFDTFVKNLNFFKSSLKCPTTCFGLYSHRQILRLLPFAEDSTVTNERINTARVLTERGWDDACIQPILPETVCKWQALIFQLCIRNPPKMQIIFLSYFYIVRIRSQRMLVYIAKFVSTVRRNYILGLKAVLIIN
jgi:hypothetical protein